MEVIRSWREEYGATRDPVEFINRIEEITKGSDQ